MRVVLLSILFSLMAAAQPSEKFQQSLRRIFDGGAARSENQRTRWIEGGEAYAVIEPAANGAGSEIVRYDPATGKRDILVSTAQLTPRHTGKPLAIEDYAWSADGKKLMVLTNKRTVLIRKPAGEYWVQDPPAGSWSKLGGPNGSEFLFPKFSPDASRVAYVRGTDLYVEDLPSNRIRRLTSDGTDMIINGTSDWVYDEEFDLADGFRLES